MQISEYHLGAILIWIYQTSTRTIWSVKTPPATLTTQHSTRWFQTHRSLRIQILILHLITWIHHGTNKCHRYSPISNLLAPFETGRELSRNRRSQPPSTTSPGFCWIKLNTRAPRIHRAKWTFALRTLRQRTSWWASSFWQWAACKAWGGTIRRYLSLTWVIMNNSRRT